MFNPAQIKHRTVVYVCDVNYVCGLTTYNCFSRWYRDNNDFTDFIHGESTPFCFRGSYLFILIIYIYMEN